MKSQKAFVIPLSILVVAILIALGVYVYMQSNLPRAIEEPAKPVACTEEAKQCPDGSFVGRTGPNCEFVCPEVVTSTGTSTATSTDPVINSISPNSGPIGTIVEIKGNNLNGFEGDMDAIIENSKGETAVLLGMTRVEPNLIRVKIESKLCKKNNSYSGLPCESYLNIVPGVYNIYTSPWGKMSNKVKFTVTAN
ncbi:MAG: IPT/TIG domain-containing protein [bacterium]